MNHKLLKNFEDQFLAGLLITNEKREIVFANQYFFSELAWSQGSLIGQSIDKLLTKSSLMFYESYVIPVLITEQRFQEIQLTLFTGTGERLPVVVSMKLGTEDPDLIFWSILNASNRNKLYEELIETRETLSIQAESLKLLSITDELTGLFNRRELNRRVLMEIERNKRFAAPLSLLILDIDHFKTINDSFGHDTGDIVLKELSDVLSAEARKTDLVARIGGEEFAILMPNIHCSEADTFSERLHKAIRSVESEIKNVTVSIGISELSQTSDNSFDKLFKNSDNALYIAKNSGRNRTVIYTLPTDSASNR